MGSGGFGKVYLAENSKGEKYAVKIIPAEEQSTIDQCINNECMNAVQLKHPNIIKTIQATYVKEK